MSEFQQPDKHYNIYKNRLTGKWDLECRFCPNLSTWLSHAMAIHAMDELERAHRGRRN